MRPACMRFALLIAAVLAGSAPVRAQPAPPELRPTGLKLMPDTPRGHFAEPLPGNVFPETQRRHLMLVTFDKAAAGQELTFAIRAVNTTASAPAVIYSGTGKVTEDGLAPLQINLARNWPVGQYDIRVTKDGQAVGLLPYRVQPASPRVTPITIPAIAIERVLGPGRTEPVERIRAGHRHLNFAATAEGANTEGVNLVWVLTAVQTPTGESEVKRLEDPGRLIENTELQFDVALQRDWPVGEYRIDVLIDGAVTASRSFRIEP